jgi:hypothetical protein
MDSLQLCTVRFLAAAESDYRLRKLAAREEAAEGPAPGLSVSLLDIPELTGEGPGAGEAGERVIQLPAALCSPGRDRANMQCSGPGLHRVPPLTVSHPGTEYCCTALNTTSLLASQAGTLFAWDFIT